MNSSAHNVMVLARQPTGAPADQPLRARVVGFADDGLVLVHAEPFGNFACEVLIAGPLPCALAVGDRVIALPLHDAEPGVILGTVGRYPAGGVATRVTVVASEAVSLKCGESSIDLRADGKVMIRGEDVLVRAKGTKRIRAGTVSIN